MGNARAGRFQTNRFHGLVKELPVLGLVDGISAGTIGVLGPTRMDYSQALSAVAVVSKRLERELDEG